MDPVLLIALRLAKEGFGKPTDILKMPADVVIGAMQFCKFAHEYENAYIELNKNETS